MHLNFLKTSIIQARIYKSFLSHFYKQTSYIKELI